ncbi:MAG: hypothetical protein Q8Q08_02625 [Candidatus Omnitrophota bacterium]|nr:hypothetical protein [Candidatus Omnitrophota bacterium]MDZ4243417.1 hypothetical protein [Candidatus Omnitrophota bacterium]
MRLKSNSGMGMVWFLATALCLPVFADTAERLTASQVERVKVCKQLLQEVDKKFLRQTMDQLEETGYPEENLQILEAVARTYTDIVQEQKIVKLRAKEWLHSMVLMNMAYLQMGGIRESGGDQEPLYQMIRRKLTGYLSPELLAHPGIFHPIEE